MKQPYHYSNECNANHHAECENPRECDCACHDEEQVEGS